MALFTNQTIRKADWLQTIHILYLSPNRFRKWQLRFTVPLPRPLYQCNHDDCKRQFNCFKGVPDGCPYCRRAPNIETANKFVDWGVAYLTFPLVVEENYLLRWKLVKGIRDEQTAKVGK